MKIIEKKVINGKGDIVYKVKIGEDELTLIQDLAHSLFCDLPKSNRLLGPARQRLKDIVSKIGKAKAVKYIYPIHENSEYKDIILRCTKCDHLLYVSNWMDGGKLIKIAATMDCPNCGEEPEWVIHGEGVFEDR